MNLTPSFTADWLILATGARHSYFGRDDWAVHAPGIKTIDDATAVRRRVLLALEQAESEEHGDARDALLTFVVLSALDDATTGRLRVGAAYLASR